MSEYTSGHLQATKGEHWKLLTELVPVGSIQYPRPFAHHDNKTPLKISHIKGALDMIGYRYEPDLTKAQAVQLYRHAQRGLLSYETIPSDELSIFVAQRGLNPHGERAARSGQVSRSALQKVLS